MLTKGESSCMTVTIVGVLPPPVGDEHERINLFIAAVGQALKTTWPGFVPAAQPVTVTVVDLPRADSAVIDAAIQIARSVRGDGNGRAWCNAKAADTLRHELERLGIRLES